MTIFQAIILGIIQGITEFLPVSSSGHLVLLQKIFRVAEPSLTFGIVVHLGIIKKAYSKTDIFINHRYNTGGNCRHSFQRFF